MRIFFTDKVFVEPVSLFDLETYSRKGNKFLCRDVDYEAAVATTG
jgi:hypothetical protein